MIRFTQVFNFAGVLVLVVLCAVQWRANRRLNLNAFELDKTRIQQEIKIVEQDKTTKGYKADLDDFRQRLTLSEETLKETEAKSEELAGERDGLRTEREQLKASLEQWIAAVAARDAALKQSNQQIATLIEERLDAVSRFNVLADRYNILVKDFEKSGVKK